MTCASAVRIEHGTLQVPIDAHRRALSADTVARSRAVPMVKTRYTCFCDNDVFYTPGWLAGLEANAETNGSGAVAPLTLIGPSSDPIIHHAGSELSVAIDRRGRPRLNSLHRLDGTPYREAVAKDFAEAGVDCDQFEYHCAFVRTDVLAEIGGHDERQTMHDHLNDSLRIRMLGHRITFEKNAVIPYHGFEPFTEHDWPYFFYRWFEQASIDSERAIGSWSPESGNCIGALTARFHRIDATCRLRHRQMAWHEPASRAPICWSACASQGEPQRPPPYRASPCAFQSSARQGILGVQAVWKAWVSTGLMTTVVTGQS